VSGQSGGRAGRREGGFVAAELVLGIGLLLVPVTLLVLTLPSWSERKTVARSIAREVSRIVAREGVCDVASANGLGEIMARNLGLAVADVTVEPICNPGALLTPGSDLEVDVTVRMPAVRIPAIGSVGAWSWTARHREPVDEYGSAP
jgi:hypothetical protein